MHISENLLTVQLGEAWRVRVLPIVHMGIYPYRQDDWTTDFPEAIVLHKFQGTWKQGSRVKQQSVGSVDNKGPKEQKLYRRAANVSACILLQF